MKATFLFQSLLIVVSLAACGREVQTIRQSGGVEDVPVNYGEMALVESAHRKFGERIYADEMISDAMGSVKVCGKMTSIYDAVRFEYYEYSIDRYRSYKESEFDIWKSRCDFGWVPGTGKY